MDKLRKNPFIITFGKKPVEYISRPFQTDEILNMFTGNPITNQVYIIVGPRGSGKTVMLSDIANRLEEDPQWTVIRCAPTADMMRIAAEGLERAKDKTGLSLKATLTIPTIGNVSIEKAGDRAGDTFRIDDVLSMFKEKGRKLLITVDEITNTYEMRNFASNLQIWMGRDFPVFFLGTALYEQIEELQNVSNLTFLYRAPKIYLQPLDLISVARSYQKSLDVSEERSNELARLTRGYSFAFQALGYLYWNASPVEELRTILPDYDAMLSNSSYSKMWQEMSSGDHNLCIAIAKCSSSKVQDIREEFGEENPNRFNQRRIRLKNRGIINTEQRGRMIFALPRFREFVLRTAILFSEEL